MRQVKTAARRLQAAALGTAAGLALSGGAHAANYVAWVWADQSGATAPYTPDPGYSYNSTGGIIHVVPLGTGAYRVDIANIYHGQPDDVQVSAYGGNTYCSTYGWSFAATTIRANVRCFDASGAPANSLFTLLYQARTAPFGTAGKAIAFLWADQPTAASYTPDTNFQYNSTGGTDTVERLGTGYYRATLPGLTRSGGNAQVTAYRANASCKPLDWYNDTAATYVEIVCHNRRGALIDEEFDLAFALNVNPALSKSGSNGAYVWASRPHAASYVPKAVYNYNGFGTGRLTVVRNGTGSYRVSIPGTLTFNTSNVLVTGYGGSNGYCSVLSWETNSIDVGCYDRRGNPRDDYFDVSFHGAQ
jgi:hypothetical protein